MTTIQKFSRDINGNSTVHFSLLNTHTNSSISLNRRRISTDKKSYGYSLQTNGNLPFTHNLKIGGLKIKDLSANEVDLVVKEIEYFLLNYGSDKQKFLLSY